MKTFFIIILCASISLSQAKHVPQLRLSVKVETVGDYTDETRNLVHDLLLERLSNIDEIVVVDSAIGYHLNILLYEIPETQCSCPPFSFYYRASFFPTSSLPFASDYSAIFLEGFSAYSKLDAVSTDVVYLLDRTHIDELRPERKYLPNNTRKSKRRLLQN